MKRILIFLGLKLWEIAKIIPLVLLVVILVFIGVSILGCIVAGFVWIVHRITSWNFDLCMLIVCIITIIIVAIIEQRNNFINWLKSNWEKAGRIAGK